MSKTKHRNSPTDQTVGLVPAGTAVVWIALTAIGLSQLFNSNPPPPAPTSKPDEIVLAVDVTLGDPSPSVPETVTDQTPAVAEPDAAPAVAVVPITAGPELMALAPPPKPQQMKTTNRRESAGPVFQSLDHGTVPGYMPDPKFPDELARAGMYGTVVIDLIVDPDGAIVSVVYRISSGWEALNISAIQQIEETWRFPPGAKRYFEKSFTFERKHGE